MHILNRRRALRCCIGFSVLLLGTGSSLLGGEALIDAVQHGDSARIDALLATHPDVHAPDADGNTALHLAARRGDSQLVRQLLRHGWLPSPTNNVGATPLIYAVGQLDSV